MARDYAKILGDSLEGDHYLTNEDLRVNKSYGYQLSNRELNEYLAYKDSIDKDYKFILPLKTFNSKQIYYFYNLELSAHNQGYFEYFTDDISNQSTILIDNLEEIMISRIASELEGSLGIEGVNTTRKKILSIIEKKDPQNQNQQIVLNMVNSFNFIYDRPAFNKDNLRKLYLLLSDGCLNAEDQLEGYYRSEMVTVGGHDGCEPEQISSCMDSLFTFVNESLFKQRHLEKFFLPSIAHYYVLYIHPYVDYNGRTARMVSLWLSLLIDFHRIQPAYISEAINDDRNNYYKAIDNSRNSHNDITYFLIYLMGLANQYYLVYKNIDKIKEDLAQSGEALTNTEQHYLKRIIVNSKRGWFNYKGFIAFCNITITKQGALKILNYFLKLGLLITRTNSKNEKIFMINDIKLKYYVN